MKKFVTFIISALAILTLFGIEKVYAASALINITSPSTTVEVGGKVTVYYTISSANALGAWNFQLVTPTNFKLNSCSDGKLVPHVGVVSNGNTKSYTITCYFTALSSGYGTFTIKNYEVEGYTSGTMAVQLGPKTIRSMTKAEIQAGLSKNNDLKALNVSGGTLTPNFNKDTLTYNITLEPETKSTTITATAADTRSTIIGTGTKSLEEGLNVFKINVKAQNGVIKTYTLNITVKELAPIEVTINDTLYNVVRKKAEIKSPNKYFKEMMLTIGEEEVPGFINETTDVVLVGLKDNDGTIFLYTYNETDKSYVIYKDFTFNSLTLEILDNNDNIPSTFTKTEITINEETINAYKLSDKSNYSLFNAINVANGETNLYMYDSTENTIIKYSNEEKVLLNKEIKDINNTKKQYEYIIIGLGGFLTLTYFTILVKLITGRKKKRILREDKPISKNIVDDIPKDIKQEDDIIEDVETEHVKQEENIIDKELDFLDEKMKRKKKK